MCNAVGIGEDKTKLATGRNLIKLFSCPGKDGLPVPPSREPEKWDLFKAYCMRDVEAERALYPRFAPFLVPDSEHALWVQDVQMNTSGVGVDTALVGAIRERWDWEERQMKR